MLHLKQIIASSFFAPADGPLKCIFLICLKLVRALSLQNFYHMQPLYF